MNFFENQQSVSYLPTALLISSDFPPLSGGIANYLHHISRLFGPQMTVLSSRMANSQAFDRRQPYQVVRAPVDAASAWQRKILLGPAWLIEAARLIRQNQPQLVLGGFAAPQILWVLSRLGRRHRLKTALFVYGNDLRKLQQPGLLAHLERRRLQDIDCFVAISQFTQDILQNELGISPDRIYIFRPGICFSRFQQADPVLPSRRSGQGKRILSVGRLVDYKGFDQVIRAVARLVEQGLEVEYTIVGRGPDRPRLEVLVATLNLTDRVQFAGFVPDTELPYYYNSCDLFVLISRETPGQAGVEGFGIVYLEANACGKPVIGGRSGGVTEAVIDGETGLLVDPHNVAEIGQALYRLLTDEALAHRLGCQGRDRVRQEFDWSRRQMEFAQTQLFLFANSGK